MAVAEKFQRQKEVARSVYFYEMGIKDKPKSKQAERILRGMPGNNIRS